MSKVYVILFLSIFILNSTSVLAVSNAYLTELFKNGVDFYAKGNYQKALEFFLKIEKNNGKAFEVYYNIGNCYFKLGKIGMAVLYYNRAKRLYPSAPDLKHNLDFINMRKKDRLKDEEGLFSKVINSIFNYISLPLFLKLALYLYILVILLYSAWVLIPYGTIYKSITKYIARSLVIILIILSIPLIYKIYYNEYYPECVVIVKKINVKSEPNSKSKTLFALHEGTIVELLKTTGDWAEIGLYKGLWKGFVKKKSILKI